MVKDYMIYDHLGSVRAVLMADAQEPYYNIVSQYDYDPFGQIISSNGNNNRDKYIGKEKDVETAMNINFEGSLADHGVRKYEDYTGRFTTPEPLWEKYYSWSPYVYSANNPIALLDPSGLNWFTNNTGEVKWLDQSGSFSEVKTETTWKDMGLNFYFFNGESLTLYKEDKSNISWNAVSGELKDGKTNSEKQLEKGGPIPEGTNYTVNPMEIQKWDNISTFDKMKSFIGSGTWPGGNSSWGELRVPINPKSDNRGDRTGNYFIHGGSSPGSRGCIDLWKNNNSFFNIFSKYQNPLPLIVKYK